ncbi:hypothetical protein [Flexithrix dorotheae]|uniref:hypothetical protein n=1 Tax=Flexithrix dorotheae TaxID=70993 RepID=UPI00037D1AAA|nr:hypothetical protein [Flexithrix dorotheae]
MKKYINKLLVLTASLLVLWACEEEYIAPTSEPNHVYITTSFGTVESRLQINGEMDFIDLSRGVVSRKWTFPEGVVELTGEENNVTSEKDLVKASFLKAGVYEVKVEQTFAGNVFIGDDPQSVNKYDTTIVVTVLDSIKANFESRRAADNSVLVNADGALNEVIAGRDIIFETKSTGEPSDLNWVFTSASGKEINISGASVTHKFSSMEAFDITLIASSNLGADTISYKNFMNVIPSTDPVDLVGITAKENVIGLVYSRDMFNPATNNPESISLTVTNSGVDYPVNVTGFTLDPLANNIVLLSLDADIYNSDLITLNYDDTKGNLRTLDGVNASSITDGQVVFEKDNLLATTSFDLGFENSTNANWPYLWWGGVWENYNFEVSSALPYEGKSSGYVVMEAGGGMIMGHRDDSGTDITFPLEGGKTYEVGCWIYMESLGDKTSIPDLRFYWSPNTDWGIGGAFFDADFPEGQWVYTSTQVKAAASDNYSFMIRGHNEFNSQECKFYMDNITVAELDLR